MYQCDINSHFFVTCSFVYLNYAVLIANAIVCIPSSQFTIATRQIVPEDVNIFILCAFYYLNVEYVRMIHQIMGVLLYHS